MRPRNSVELNSDLLHENTKLRICAIIAVRNEFEYLRILLPKLERQCIDVIILDNQSEDQSQVLFDRFWRHPILEVKEIPYKGFFSLTEQLQVKNRLIKDLSHDWIIHHDADEILEHHHGQSLRVAIEEANYQGYNCLNFDEFVFIPEPGSNYCGLDYYQSMRNYYFFEPGPNRLNRVFQRSADLDFLSQAGHRLLGENLRIYPSNHTLRHYITLSEDHVREKYINRIYDPVDLAKGWHGNRKSINPDKLILPSKSPFLTTLNGSQTPERKNAVQSHFWEWN